jgi:hypothetical protein
LRPIEKNQPAKRAADDAKMSVPGAHPSPVGEGRVRVLDEVEISDRVTVHAKPQDAEGRK